MIRSQAFCQEHGGWIRNCCLRFLSERKYPKRKAVGYSATSVDCYHNSSHNIISDGGVTHRQSYHIRGRFVHSQDT